MTKTILIFVARLIFAAVFGVGLWFKLTGMEATAGYIASVGLPNPTVLAWLAVVFETTLVIAFLTGVFFSEAALLAALYVLFLAFAFHWPPHNPMELGLFIDHFTFIAGLLFAAVHGPGSRWVVPAGILWSGAQRQARAAG